METIAVIENGIVANLIASERLDVVQLMLPDSELVLATEETGRPFIGQRFMSGKFVPIPTDTTWTFDESLWTWIPPIPYPDDGLPYYWDKEAQNWVELAIVEFNEDGVPVENSVPPVQ